MSVLSKIIFLVVVLAAIISLSIMPQKMVEVQAPSMTEKQLPAKVAENPKTVKKTTVETVEISTQTASKQTEAEATSPPPTPQEPNLVPLEEVNTKTRQALVNILCTTKWSGPFSPITGSGIIIDPKGVILTNAHVAQYFLLKDYLTKDFIDCVIRTGSPASPTYKADLIFISSAWVKNNYKNITSSDPQGTGENDLALLLIKSRIIPTESLPSSFLSVAPDYDEDSVSVGTPVLLSGYPAGFLGGIAIQKNLWLVSAPASILEVFTYSDKPSYDIDVFSIGGSVVAQKGSSGGAVVSQKSGRLLGIIVTSTESAQTGDRDLRATTVAHVSRTLSSEMGFGLKDLLSASKNEIELISRSFLETVAPALTKIFTDELDK